MLTCINRFFPTSELIKPLKVGFGQVWGAGRTGPSAGTQSGCLAASGSWDLGPPGGRTEPSGQGELKAEWDFPHRSLSPERLVEFADSLGCEGRGQSGSSREVLERRQVQAVPWLHRGLVLPHVSWLLLHQWPASLSAGCSGGPQVLLEDEPLQKELPAH